jgi:hypothetical protein
MNRRMVRAGMTLSVVFACIIVSCQHAKAAELEWFLQPVAHGSDPSDGGVSDTTFDFAGGGATLTAGKNRRWEIEGALGRKAFNCDARRDCKSTAGATFGVRYYPGRKRGN